MIWFIILIFFSHDFIYYYLTYNLNIKYRCGKNLSLFFPQLWIILTKFAYRFVSGQYQVTFEDIEMANLKAVRVMVTLFQTIKGFWLVLPYRKHIVKSILTKQSDSQTILRHRNLWIGEYTGWTIGIFRNIFC